MSMDAYYQVSDEAPMPGREKEYETFKAQAAQAAQESPRAAMEAMDKIVNVCMTRTAAREACEATAPPESDKPWGEKEDRKLAKAGKALEAAKARLVEATQALRDSTTASAKLLASEDTNSTAYRERKERWSKEVSSLTRKLKEAAEEEETCRRSVQKLEQDKARAAVAITREAAIKSEAVAMARKKKLLDAIKAIEELDDGPEQ